MSGFSGGSSSGGGSSSPILVDVYNSVSVLCGHNTHVRIPFDSEQHKDIAGMHNNSTNKSRLVCQRAGIKHISWSCDPTASGSLTVAQIDLYVNGSNYGAGDYSMMRFQGFAVRVSASLEVYADVGDYFELDAYGSTPTTNDWAFNGHFSMVEL